MYYDTVLKFTDKNYKAGLKSSKRIITMKKYKIELMSLPSHVKTEVCKLYVAFSGQQITCKYCNNKGIVQ